MIQKGEAAQRRRRWTVGRLSGAWPSARGLLHPAGSSGHATIPRCQTSLAWSLLQGSTMGRSRFGRYRQVGHFWLGSGPRGLSCTFRSGTRGAASWLRGVAVTCRPELPLPLIECPSLSLGLLLLNLSGHQDVVRDLSFTPSGSLILVSASRDKTLRIWDLNKHGMEVTEWPGNPKILYLPLFLLDQCHFIQNSVSQPFFLLLPPEETF